jgi:hypothetical protein
MYVILILIGSVYVVAILAQLRGYAVSVNTPSVEIDKPAHEPTCMTAN